MFDDEDIHPAIESLTLGRISGHEGFRGTFALGFHGYGGDFSGLEVFFDGYGAVGGKLEEGVALTIAAVHMGDDEDLGHGPVLEIVDHFIQRHVLSDAGAPVLENLIFQGKANGVLRVQGGAQCFGSPRKQAIKGGKQRYKEVVHSHGFKIGALT